MQSKRLKLWIIFSAVCVAIFCLFLFLSLGFRLKTVDVEFQSRLTQEETKLPSGIQDEIENYFPYKKNILVLKFDDTISKVEKNYPYVKINQVIKNFPNVARVYISERVPKYRVLDADDPDMWLVLDEDFKVLEKLTTDELLKDNMYNSMSFFNKTIEISNSNLKSGAKVGDFVKGYETLNAEVNQIFSGIYGRTNDYSSAFLVEKIVTEKQVSFNVVMKNNARDDYKGCNILIEGQDNLKTKAFVGATTFQEEIRDDSSINIPSTVIRIYYSNGTYKGIKYTASES